MVNLVVRHGSHTQGTASHSSPRMKSPSTSIANRLSKATTTAVTAAASPSAAGCGASERIVPSPIRVPFHHNNTNGGTHRPVSPLTASESMFGAAVGVGASHFIHHRAHSSARVDSEGEIRQQPSEGSINSGSDLVCDYDQSITPLYEMLESSQWDQAGARCRTHPQEVHTWIVRRDTNDNIRWKLLPLHAAVIFQASMAVVEAMLSEHPIAVAKRDDQGMLPIHLAFRHKSSEVLIEKLIRQYPGGLTVKDRKDRLPIDHAKDAQFSFSTMKLYSETYARCQNIGSAAMMNGGDKSTSLNEKSRLSTIKEAYEARIKDMTKEHEHSLHELKTQKAKEAQSALALHNAEMDELRDLLSREVSSGQKVSQLEGELSRMAEALAASNQEGKVLRRVVHEQKSQHETLVEQLHRISQDQKSLHDSCLQLQEQLDQAHQLREQLIRTLLQKEDGKDVRVSNDACQLSSKLLTQTETLLKECSRGGQRDASETDVRKTPVSTGRVTSLTGAAAPATADAAPSTAPWGEMADHEDDISAITEISHF